MDEARASRTLAATAAAVMALGILVGRAPYAWAADPIDTQTDIPNAPATVSDAPQAPAQPTGGFEDPRKDQQVLDIQSPVRNDIPDRDALRDDGAERPERVIPEPTKTNTSPDKAIAEQVRQVVREDPLLSVAGQKVKVKARKGRVTLKGRVTSEEEKARIGELAAGIVGTSMVTNKLKVKPNKKIMPEAQP